jgi:hypothetical protein
VEPNGNLMSSFLGDIEVVTGLVGGVSSTPVHGLFIGTLQ